eukprot:TRINITY_DN2025_c1_g1_i1.p1 TRINITY_DN2025_c1_g1~~TRINITY_DN2025_c1_g1_i1.p1  ORF type:complete len:555 (-),score=169.84 TRINITY_DN2025_c1_g1_i1:16-1680(-)
MEASDGESRKRKKESGSGSETEEDENLLKSLQQSNGKHLSDASPQASLYDEEELMEPEPNIRSIELVDRVISTPKIEAQLPASYKDCWNTTHVKFPCSSRNTYQKSGKILSKWYLIQSVLTSPSLLSSLDLEEAIREYNPSINDFGGLHHFLNEVLTEEESVKFLSETLIFIITLALKLPHLFSHPLPILQAGFEASIDLSQIQIASILANAFLCTFPKQGGSASSTFIRCPEINFGNLFSGTGWKRECTSSQAAKLRCVLNYFDRIFKKYSADELTNKCMSKMSFQRKIISNPPDWENSEKILTNLKIERKNFIEDSTWKFLQVDFANKMIGGGVLGRGCIQEEIRFMINTELISSLLFCAEMEDDEAILILGSERFSNYSGYSQTFTWEGDFQDETPRDPMGRLKTQIVAIDALHFGNFTEIRMQQFEVRNILRELNKAYIGFSGAHPGSQIATGNWGCGAFGGYHDLKAMIQLMAAAQLDLDVSYFTFGVSGLGDSLDEVHSILREKNITIGRIFKRLEAIGKERSKSSIGSLESEEAPQVFTILIEEFEQ